MLIANRIVQMPNGVPVYTRSRPMMAAIMISPMQGTDIALPAIFAWDVSLIVPRASFGAPAFRA